MRTWIKTSAIEENFASNQNIANSVNACYSLYCKVAGDGKGNYLKDTKFEGQAFKWGTELVTPDGLQHGKPCACGSSYDKNTDKFYETGKQVSASDIKISEILKYMTQMYPAIKLHRNLQTAILISTMVMLLMTNQINQIILKRLSRNK